ncbi:MAG: DNA polymerase Y family protein [Proteobacteria bacterium]|nr:DNA polymerase Y family protein [Pseudomonadota bacterium]
MLWCALYLPDLPLQVFTRGRSEAAPLAVLDGHPRRRVVAADPAAMARGVEPGLGRASALAIAPELCLVDRQPALEHAALIDIATWAGRFTPAISLDPPHAILLEVETCLRLFGGLVPLGRQITKGIEELGFHARLAVAQTPLAARWLARFGAGDDAGKALAARLDPLPLIALADGTPVGPDSLDLLTGTGHASLGEVRRLPRHGLARRHAQAVTDALDRAYGRIPDPRPWFSPPERYASRLPLPTPSDQVDTLLFAARRLLAGLAGWLDARQAGIERFTLVLEFERNSQAPEAPLEIVLGTLSQDMQRCQLLAREHLNRLPLPAAVDALRLTADEPHPLAPPAGELFQGDDGQPGDAGLLLATLRARLGDQAVRCLTSHPDHRPEKAWRWVEPQPPDRSRGRQEPPLPASPRPLWLLPEPRPIPAPPPWTLLTGPERIASGWWDGPEATVRRDYFVARSQDGGLAWVFRDGVAPHYWYLHGHFA